MMSFHLFNATWIHMTQCSGLSVGGVQQRSLMRRSCLLFSIIQSATSMCPSCWERKQLPPWCPDCLPLSGRSGPCGRLFQVILLWHFCHSQWRIVGKMRKKGKAGMTFIQVLRRFAFCWRIDECKLRSGEGLTMVVQVKKKKKKLLFFFTTA